MWHSDDVRSIIMYSTCLKAEFVTLVSSKKSRRALSDFFHLPAPLQETFFSESESYRFESELTYECDPTSTFVDDLGDLHDSQTISCQWGSDQEGVWSETTLMTCTSEFGRGLGVG